MAIDLKLGRWRREGVAAALASVLLLAVPLFADEVSGSVTTTAGVPLAGARVIIFDLPLLTFLETRTDRQGRYRIEAPSGSFRLGASVRDLAYVEVGVTLSGGALQQDFSLGDEIEPGRWTLAGDTSPEELAASNSGALLADGSALFCHSTRDPVQFEPVSLAKSFPPDSLDHQGCSALTLLGSGDLLYVGGQKSTDFRDSTDRVKSFNTWTGTWTLEPSLNLERWYPALARLADETLLVCGGGQRPAAARTETCELRDPTTGVWTMTAPMAQGSEYSPMALLHTGEVLKNWFPPELYDPVTRSWRATGSYAQSADRSALFPDHCDHSLALLRNGDAVITGILPLASNPDPVMAEHYDACAGSWSLGGDNDVIARSRVESVPLPDGRILVAAGKLEQSAPGVFVNAWGYTRLADLYDPGRRRWRPVQELRIAREYHANTFLLADGRVLTTGGTGEPGMSTSPDMGIDLFEPPYLFRGPRPAINALASTRAENGEWLALDVARAPAVTSVILLGTQATTHWVDGAIARRLALPFRQLGTALEVRVPASAVAAPAGWYLLFVMVDDVPSEGRLLRVVAAAAPPSPDLVGNALWMVKFGADARLDWRQGPLNPSRYNLLRVSAKVDVEHSPSGVGDETPVAAPDEEWWTDLGAIAGGAPLAYYQVLGRNCDGSTRWP